MIPNVYIPYQFLYPEPSINQNNIYQMFYPQIYQQSLMNGLALASNFSFENNYFSTQKDIYHTETIILQRKIDQKDDLFQQQQEVGEKQNQQFKKLQLKTRQKYGRNITSNIFRSMVKRITGQIHFKRLAIKIIAQRNFSITYQNFIDELNRAISTFSSYVKKYQMKSLIYAKANNKKSYQICTVFRILGKIYLRQEHTLNIFYSKKINKDSRKLHFVLARQMQQMLK